MSPVAVSSEHPGGRGWGLLLFAILAGRSMHSKATEHTGEHGCTQSRTCAEQLDVESGHMQSLAHWPTPPTTGEIA